MTANIPPLAFPSCIDKGEEVEYFTGLTKREFYAAIALQGLLSAANPQISEKGLKTLALMAVDSADALIEALNK